MNNISPQSSSNSEENPSLSVKQFYGDKCQSSLKKYSISSKTSNLVKQLPHRLNNILGPSQVWKIFQKQHEALEFAKYKRSGLMTFVFQQSDGTRLFLVANPQIFWHYDEQKVTSQRHSFEVIPDSSVCKLYFDLEFDVQYNPTKDGSQVVDTFVSLVLYFLLVIFKIKATRDQILNLDSSTNEKFSRHLIFQLNPYVFCNNKVVGEFVDLVCKKLLLYIGSYGKEVVGSKSDINKKEIEFCKCCLSNLKSSGCIKDSSLLLADLRSLIVVNRKGSEGLICDTSVYSRNRHFRLFKNSKWGKNVPLNLSVNNLYYPSDLLTRKNLGDDIVSETYFLDSLVSYIRLPHGRLTDLKVIHFKNPLTSTEENECLLKIAPSLPTFSTDYLSYQPSSPYPDVDSFINALVLPGRIWRSAYFSASSVIAYDIIGYRYCQNVGRQHRSNNVKYIVDLESYTYYQKCHDPDCSLFRSNLLCLPEELKFKLDNNSSLSDADLSEIASVAEDLSNISEEAI